MGNICCISCGNCYISRLRKVAASRIFQMYSLVLWCAPQIFGSIPGTNPFQHVPPAFIFPKE